MLDIDDHGFSTEESVSQTRVKEPIPSPSSTANFLKQELEIYQFNMQMMDHYEVFDMQKDRMVGS